MNIYSEWFYRQEAQLREDFFEFLRFPSIGTDPAYDKSGAACAGWLGSYLEQKGFSLQQWETEGYPTLFAHSLHAGENSPTLLFYQHYDVQPVDPLDQWDSDPFQPTVREGKVYARGAADNKGQCFYVLAALVAFLELEGREKINLKIVIEGEEERGSPGLARLLNKKKEALAADHLFIVDCEMPGKDQPAVTLGVRGVVFLDLTCRNSRVDLHSGAFGGVAMNPARALVNALSRCFDPKGHIAIPGFYDEVKALTAEEKSAVDCSTEMTEQGVSLGVKALAREEGYSVTEANWLRPTLEINGLSSGYSGAGVKTIIPAAAKVKLSCRLVPNQKPEQIGDLVARFLVKNLPQDMELKVDIHPGAEGIISPLQSEAIDKAVEACSKAFSRPCLRILSGASIPIAAQLAAASGAFPIFMGVGLAEDQIHAPNESFSWERFKRGFFIITELVASFARGKS